MLLETPYKNGDTISLKGSHSARIFEKGKEPYLLETGAILSL